MVCLVISGSLETPTEWATWKKKNIRRETLENKFEFQEGNLENVGVEKYNQNEGNFAK